MNHKNLIKKPLIIAVVGKGGVGKSIITALFAKNVSQNYNFKMLLIDADPTHPHLSNMVKLIPQVSLEMIRIDLINKTLDKEKSIQELAENIDFEVYNAIVEGKDFSLISIGQPEDPGCFCPSNTLLRKVIESISKDFDIILIDCEAGLEQINRMVIESVDIILIVSDLSIRSVETAKTLQKSAKNFTNYKKLGIVLNKVKGDVSYIINKLEELDLPLLAEIPEDSKILEFDVRGDPIIDIPNNSISLLSMNKLVEQILNSKYLMD
ncbi:MAG: ATP-binding protein [Promethearchaeota archaeon]|jgi:CO dehydrogenase maturation factor